MSPEIFQLNFVMPCSIRSWFFLWSPVFFPDFLWLFHWLQLRLVSLSSSRSTICLRILQSLEICPVFFCLYFNEDFHSSLFVYFFLVNLLLFFFSGYYAMRHTTQSTSWIGCFKIDSTNQYDNDILLTQA